MDAVFPSYCFRCIFTRAATSPKGWNTKGRQLQMDPRKSVDENNGCFKRCLYHDPQFIILESPSGSMSPSHPQSTANQPVLHSQQASRAWVCGWPTDAVTKSWLPSDVSDAENMAPDYKHFRQDDSSLVDVRHLKRLVRINAQLKVTASDPERGLTFAPINSS